MFLSDRFYFSCMHPFGQLYSILLNPEPGIIKWMKNKKNIYVSIRYDMTTSYQSGIFSAYLASAIQHFIMSHLINEKQNKNV